MDADRFADALVRMAATALMAYGAVQMIRQRAAAPVAGDLPVLSR